MGSFPRNEAETLVLANEMATGLANNTTIYPAPPVATTNLTTLTSAFVAAQSALTAAKAASEAATNAKLNALEAMAEAMKKDLRYAEDTVNYPLMPLPKQ